MTALGNFADGPTAADSRPLRICLLGYRSHPYCGGQGVYLHYLSKALVDAGHQVDVISGQPYPKLDPRVQLIKMPGLNLFECENPTRALRWRHLLSWTDFFEWWSKLTGGFAEPYTFGRRVAKYLRRHGHRYDIVHDNQCLAYGLLDIERQGLPVVATIHHPITRDRQLALDAAPDWRYRLLVRRWHNFLRMQIRVARRLRNIVTVSEQSRRDIVDQFGVNTDRITLVHNGIDTALFRPRPDIAQRPFRIMTTASADQPLKGLRFLLDAVAQLRESFPQLELLVVGRLQEGGDTEKLLEQLQLRDSVQFVSGISNDEMVNYYAEATVVACPSLYEGFGLPAGEAMACGVPVVSSDGGALPEVVGDAGIVVPAGDSEALAGALRTLLEDKDIRSRLAEQGRARILRQFSWKLAAERLTRYYRGLISEAPSTLQSDGESARQIDRAEAA
ncbi:GDP-mannose-dependent alpha-(1-2)-phosphatidylinositol mannosyltransferase [Microbulbifer aggregans]|uniref:GDP-mannose-dependent alpha-(1-2)-phosphatidylinositol mannosyltransferase n=1 Tax=Microbulbifer aggregans TaxID=1769779 RepID=A0A1C9WB46_9GAMM|nr:glycosyltransferase family 4 protein [Microbulbifer aggregans]AOS98375.1 GDP-mannose-dependent alpha-(1-2)-phosphatidylinositol mannosyltransferase [Microbulbifer aggregans]